MFQFVLAFIVSFLVTSVSVQWLIVKLKEAGITGIDMNKPDKPLIPEMGGIAVVIGTIVGIYFLLALYDIFEIGDPMSHFLMASLITLLGIAFIGILDDLVDMRQLIKAFLPFVIAMPLGHYVDQVIIFPIIGGVNFGWGIYLIVPLSITCAANSANMLEGFNGLGTGLGIIIVTTLALLSILNDVESGLYLFAPLLGALMAFLFYNRFPSQIFPGDSLTLFLGGTIACGAFIANLKLETLVLLIPMILEFFLKLRGRFKGECFAMSMENGYLVHTGKIESLTHLLMDRFNVSEKKLVYMLWGIEGLLGVVVVVMSVV